MSDTPSPDLPQLLIDLGVLVERRWAALLAPHGLSPAEYGVLAALVREGPLNATGVAAQVTLEQSLISRTAQRLYEKRLITRRRSRTDRRNVTLRATPAGEELVGRLARPLGELAEELARGIPPRRLQPATEVMAAVLRNAQPPEASQ